MSQTVKHKTELHWRYRALEKLGQGGEGEVYLAEDRLTGRSVVVKISVKGSGHDLKLEFIRLYRMDHSGLLKAFDYYCQDEKSLAAFEHFSGATLDTYIQQNQPDKKELWDIWVRMAGIVAYLHGREYIHGDIKPGNILIGPEGRVKLIDLGLARKTSAELSSGFTGTAEYSAPEVLSGSAGPTQSSDVYSLGLLLFQMMTGQLPSAKDRLEENQSWSLRLRETLDDKQSEIGIKALSFWPQERYHSASQLIQALSHSGSGCCLEPPGSFRYSGQNAALAKAVEHLRPGRSGLFIVSAGPGRGKTSFLRELNFISQMAGLSSACLNAGRIEEDKLYQVIPPDTVLLIDGITDGDTLDWLKERPGQTVVAINPSNHRFPKIGNAALLKFQKHEYCNVLSNYLTGISAWELYNLSDWIWRKAGSNITFARLYLKYCQASAVIGQKQNHWQIDWQKMFFDRTIPEDIAADIGRRWKSLDNEGRETLKKICLEGDAVSQKTAAVSDPDYWLDDSGRVDGDILRSFILEQTDRSLKTVMTAPAASGLKNEAPSLARWIFWDEINMQQQWLSEGKRLFEQAKSVNDLEKMLYIGRLLIDSGRLVIKEQVQMARKLVDLYQRTSRWAPAIELWEAMAGKLSGEWDYYQILSKLYANKGEYIPALDALESGVQSIRTADQHCLYLAYKGWVLGLQGKMDEGGAALDEALKSADSSQCSDSTCFEIYNSLARHHHLLNDFEQVVCWAEKAALIETPDVTGKAKLLNILGYSLLQAGNLTKAKSYIETCINLIEQEGQYGILCYAWCNLGLINIRLKDWGNALLCLQKAENNFNVGDGFALQANIIVNLALVYGKLDQTNLSKEKYLAAYNVYNEIADVQGMLISLANAALKDHLLGKIEYAIKTLTRCLDLALKNELDHVASIIRKDIGIVYTEDDRYGEGLDFIQKAMVVSSQKIHWDCLYYGALAAGGLNDLIKMNDLLVMARNKTEDETEKAQLKMLEGIYMAKNGDLKKGLDLAMEAAGELKDNGDPAESAKTWLKTGELAISSDGFTDAEKMMPGLLFAEAEFQKMGAPVYLERTRNTILAAVHQLFAPGNIMPGTQMLEGLYQIAALLDPGRNQAELAQSCLDVTVKLLNAERGGLFLMDENSKLFLAAKTDLDPDTQHDALEFSSNAVMAAAAGETMVVSNDAQLDETLSSRLSVKRNAIRSLLCLPLRSREGTLGAIYLDSRLKSGIFNQAQRDFTKALAQILGAVIESHRLLEELRSKSREHHGSGSKALLGMIGNSAAVKSMIKRIKAAAPTDVTVLLDGESGTGKEMAAQIVHQLSSRKDKKFLALDCGSLPETLLESELFGYIKGAFTGANRDKTGLFEAADGGTVFLDEIASASPGVQARLLRVIEAGEIRRVGSDAVSHVDVRMICATNKDLEIEINEGRFREDLYYRLKGIKIDIPPLRERGDDVLILAEYFKNKFQKKHNKGRLTFTEEARRSIIINSWPGNIRELENTIQKAVLLAQEKVITGKDLEIDGYFLESGQTLKQEINSTQKEKILRILEATEGNYTKAAKIYGVSVRHFYRILEKFGINRDINVN
ncbi:sigma 54-interacting transcriptional regulator [candidate division TA06 bacterium]|nr:sigma 54-interacting transcriptional regulator [candidate division TA06 bacterium]